MPRREAWTTIAGCPLALCHATGRRRRVACRTGIAHVRPDLGTAIVVLTHDDKFDLPLLTAALAGDAFYIGALGSKRNQERRRERLLEAGVPEADLDRISGPCGLDIGAESPAETALSTLAEILAMRAGRTGGSLTKSGRPIHADVAAGKK